MSEKEDYSPYSDKELQQLKEIHLQTIQHYTKLLEIKDLSQETLLEIRLCLEFTQKDLAQLEIEICKRDTKN